jgi:hypothetical protein
MGFRLDQQPWVRRRRHIANRSVLRLSAVLAVHALLGGCGPPVPSDAVACVEQTVDGAMDDAAIAVVVRQCTSKYRTGTRTWFRLPAGAMEKLKAEASVDYSGQRLSGKVYNGTALSICRLELSIVTKVDSGATEKTSYWTNLYDVAPASVGYFDVSFLKGAGLDRWQLTGAGYCVG